MKRLLLSILAGIGNITPGLSGCAMLIIFGLYENCINAISNIFKDFKNSIIYLFPVAIGIGIGTFCFSNIISYAITNYNAITYLIFVGFIFGTIPELIKEGTKKGMKQSYIIPFLITLSLGILLLFIKGNNINQIVNPSILKYIIIGLILAFSTIIPGISGTVIFSLLGVYSLYLNAINTLNIKALIPIFIGFAFGAFILSKIISYLLKNFYGYTYFAIIGFTISTIPALILGIKFTSSELLIGIPLAILAFIITTYTFNLSTKKSN